MSENKAAGSAKKSEGYRLEVGNRAEEFNFKLILIGEDSLEYHLDVSEDSDRKELVRAALNKLADRWPDADISFEADGARRIKKIL